MNPRGRPKKYRIVRSDPEIHQFSPRGKPGRPDEIELTMDEFEAIRLAHYAMLPQKEVALSMHISQQTVSRIIQSALKKIAQCLVEGNIIRIRGGYYALTSKPFVKKAKPKNRRPDIYRATQDWGLQRLHEAAFKLGHQNSPIKPENPPK
jgi:uncharacterized protein